DRSFDRGSTKAWTFWGTESGHDPAHSHGCSCAASAGRYAGSRTGSDQAAQHVDQPAALLFRTDRDAQEVLDARLLEMPDQNAALPERNREIGTALAPMAREDEVGLRRQHLEAEPRELTRQRFAVRHDACTGLLKPRVVRDGSSGACEGEAIDGVGVET